MSEPRAAREAGPPPSDPLGPQAAQLVERLLDDAARRGEALLCWVRAAVCAAALARLAWFSGHTLLALDVRDLLDTATLLAGIGGSFVVLRFVRRGAPLRPRERGGSRGGCGTARGSAPPAPWYWEYREV